MIVSHEEIKNTLFGKFVECMISGIGPAIIQLDFNKLEPKVILNGTEVDVRVTFERFLEVLKNEEGFEGVSAQPQQQEVPATASAVIEEIRDAVDELEGEIEDIRDAVPCFDSVHSEVVSSVYDQVRETINDAVSEALYEHSWGQPDIWRAESLVNTVRSSLERIDEMVEDE